MNDLDQKTDEEIVGEVLENKEVFSLLIKRYERKLGRYIKRLGVDKDEDVEDLLQNSFIKAYRNIQDFDRKLSFSSWIYRIVHNETISFFRARSIRPEGNLVEAGEEIISFLHDDLDPWITANERNNAAHLTGSLNKLDEKYRNVIILRYFEGLEYEEIADILKIPAGSVATLIHRAKKKLGQSLSYLSKNL